MPFFARAQKRALRRQLMTRLAIVLTLTVSACEDEVDWEEPAQECEPGSMRCIDERQRQVCGSDGVWATAPACSSQLCAEGECDGICAPGSQSCVALEFRDVEPTSCTLPQHG